MTFQKIFSLVLLSINSYVGLRFILNVFHILQTSKYSKTATLVYAIIFLALALVGFYFLFIEKKVRLSFWISIAPWILIIVFLFLNMIFGDYK
ncbi:MAG: hypothetical protein KDC15_13040 [Chitinophagaceae bacterium]|nr:hypothetical protein [Chitinophagaceae bacterium]